MLLRPKPQGYGGKGVNSRSAMGLASSMTTLVLTVQLFCTLVLYGIFRNLCTEYICFCTEYKYAEYVLWHKFSCFFKLSTGGEG